MRMECERHVGRFERRRMSGSGTVGEDVLNGVGVEGRVQGSLIGKMLGVEGWIGRA